jgi:hypothetical protein
MFYKNTNKWKAGEMIERFKSGNMPKGKSYYEIELTLLLLDNNKYEDYPDADFGVYCPTEELLEEKGFEKVCGFNGEERHSLYIFKSDNEVLIGQVFCGGSRYYILDLDIYNEFVEKFTFYVEKYDKKGIYANYKVV